MSTFKDVMDRYQRLRSEIAVLDSVVNYLSQFKYTNKHKSMSGFVDSNGLLVPTEIVQDVIDCLEKTMLDPLLTELKHHEKRGVEDDNEKTIKKVKDENQKKGQANVKKQPVRAIIGRSAAKH